MGQKYPLMRNKLFLIRGQLFKFRKLILLVDKGTSRRVNKGAVDELTREQ